MVLVSDGKLCGKREGEGLDPEAHGILGRLLPPAPEDCLEGLTLGIRCLPAVFLFSFSSFDEVMMDK